MLHKIVRYVIYHTYENNPFRIYEWVPRGYEQGITFRPEHAKLNWTDTSKIAYED